jgi:nicotinamidase-related amidase
MTNAPTPNRPVLLVVDVQVGVMGNSWDATRVIANVARSIERARERGVPVIWVQHEGDEMPRDSAAWQLVPELVPQPGDVRIHKRYESSFEDTTLEAELSRVGATHIVLAGAQSSWCIRATAYGALDRGFNLTLIRDAHTTGDIELGPGDRIEAASIVKELNVAMTWVSYPGRRSGTTIAEDVDFELPGG